MSVCLLPVLYIGCLAVFCISGCFSVCLYVPGAACLSVFACLYVCLLSVLYTYWLSFCRYKPGTVCLFVCYPSFTLVVFLPLYARDCLSVCLFLSDIVCLSAVICQVDLSVLPLYWLSFCCYESGAAYLSVGYPYCILVVFLQL